MEARYPVRTLVSQQDSTTADYIARELRYHGHTVDLAADGDDALAKGQDRHYGVLILDPRLHGRRVCRELRGSGIGTPILMLTPMATRRERIASLQAGADDFVTRPFSGDELVARVEVLLQRGPQTPAPRATELCAGDLVLNRRTKDVHRAGQRIELTQREFALLESLMAAAGEARSRRQLLREVWGYDDDTNTNIVAVFIRHLRNKIDKGHDAALIETQRGYGYRIALPEGVDSPA